MLNLNGYKEYLSAHGANLAEIRRNRSYDHVNATFRGDPAYKRVYVLTKDGWRFEDAKYQRHSTESISKDAVDYYLQFRPGVRYPAGTYVIVPDERSPEINLSKTELIDPFRQPVQERTQWWMIVSRTESNMFIRHSILKCDWNFKWIYGGKIQECMGCLRSMSSYSSGISETDIGTYVDNLAAGWLPDTHYLYGEELSILGLSDTRTINYMTRFIISHNELDPRVFQVTKIRDVSPAGVIKFSLDQSEFDSKRDNAELMVCNYYANDGETVVGGTEDKWSDDVTNSRIYQMIINENGELVPYEGDNILPLTIGESSYYMVKFSGLDVTPIWRIVLLETDESLTDEETKYYRGLIKITTMDDGIVSVKPGKVNSLAGKRFALEVTDNKGEYYSSIETEVQRREA